MGRRRHTRNPLGRKQRQRHPAVRGPQRPCPRASFPPDGETRALEVASTRRSGSGILTTGKEDPQLHRPFQRSALVCCLQRRPSPAFIGASAPHRAAALGPRTLVNKSDQVDLGNLCPLADRSAAITASPWWLRARAGPCSPLSCSPGTGKVSLPARRTRPRP